MIIPSGLKKGDTIGVIAPSNPIIDDNIEELDRAKQIIESLGFKIKYSKNLFSNTNGYSSSAKEKADDLNDMFKDNEVKMIWCAKGGENSNTIFEYIDYEMIKQNPKIICGYSDITSITNIISQKTGLVTFNSTNFKTIATDETDYSLKEAMKRFCEGSLELGTSNDEYTEIRSGIAEGQLIGGNLSLTRTLVAGKYSVDFEGKILFLEELGYETGPALASNYLYFMKQNDVFKKIKGIWLGNYSHESGISLEQILLDTLGDDFKGPIIKSENFGHIENKTVIPIGITAKIDTDTKQKIQLLENCIK
ncbi:MAG: LD-carboxypeptidase [Clostridia bacterium]|nr:LD-carboxypeptidase [Clostridia bacterium]